MKKTLVLHPQDTSTDFLIPIYQNVKDKLVIRNGFKDKERIVSLIREYPRVMMMGHGSPHGLFNVCPNEWGFVVESSFVTELSSKSDNIMIWCNADQFVNRYNLNGFYTGMFISEVAEANYCGLINVSQGEVNESNECFSRVLGEIIDLPQSLRYEKLMKSEYKSLSEKNIVAEYNFIRLYNK
jgi:hypothetical protein